MKKIQTESSAQPNRAWQDCMQLHEAVSND